MAALEERGEALLAAVLEQLGAADLARVSCVSRSWHRAAADERLWERHCRQHLCLPPGAENPVDISGGPCASWRRCFRAWRTALARYDDVVAGRALAIWRTLQDWTAANVPSIYASLQPGVSEEELDRAEEELGCVLPPAFRLLWRIHNGQSLLFDRIFDLQQRRHHQQQQRLREQHLAGLHQTPAQRRQAEEAAAAEGAQEYVAASVEAVGSAAGLWLGLLGGYSFYDHVVSVRLLPLERAIFWTRRLKETGVVPPDCNWLIIAASFNFIKRFYLDLDSGQVLVAKRNMRSVFPCVRGRPPIPSRQALPAASTTTTPAAAAVPIPPASGAAAAESAGGGGGGGGFLVPEQSPLDTGPSACCATGIVRVGEGDVDGRGLLPWLEAYAAALDSGHFAVSRLDPDDESSIGISLFPANPPAKRMALTRGVEVRCSTIFVPEMCDRNENFFFTYNIEMRLRAPSEQDGSPAAGMPAGCRLLSRHWLITDANGETQEVRGDGVIGLFPVLRPGEPAFVYRSCTGLSTATGSMEGEFTFTVNSPSTPGVRLANFEAVVPRLDLVMPDFIF